MASERSRAALDQLTAYWANRISPARVRIRWNRPWQTWDVTCPCCYGSTVAQWPGHWAMALALALDHAERVHGG